MPQIPAWNLDGDPAPPGGNPIIPPTPPRPINVWASVATNYPRLTVGLEPAAAKEASAQLAGIGTGTRAVGGT